MASAHNSDEPEAKRQELSSHWERQHNMADLLLGDSPKPAQVSPTEVYNPVSAVPAGSSSLLPSSDLNHLVNAISRLISIQTDGLHQQRQNNMHQQYMAQALQNDLGNRIAKCEAKDDEPMVSEVDSAISSLSESKQLLSKIQALVKSRGAKVKKLLLQHVASIDRIEKLKKTLDDLSKGQVPAGFKPFKLPFESEGWQHVDEALGAELGQELKGENLENLRKASYISYLIQITKVDLSLELHREKDLRVSASLDKYIESCVAEVSAERDALVGTLYIKLNDGLFPDLSSQAKTFAVRTYSLIVQEVARDKKKAIEKIESDTKARNDALDKAASLPPERVIEEAVRSILKKGKQPSGVDWTSMLSSVPIENPRWRDVTDVKVDPKITGKGKGTSTKPKNEKSPGGARGPNTSSSVPAIGKGKGKDKGKGKQKKVVQIKDSKAKGLGKDKGKGKKDFGYPQKGKTKGKDQKGRGKGSGSGGRAW